MATPSENLEERRQQLDAARLVASMKQADYWERYIDAWLEMNPHGGTYKFSFWPFQPQPSRECFEMLQDRYGGAGWKTDYEFANYYGQTQFTLKRK